MAKQRAIRNLYRYWSLIVFGCALLFFAPANRAEHSSLPFSAAPPAASPTVSPSPTAPSSDTKRPNVVRRFFSWVMHGFNRLFRRSRPPVISDPPFVSITASASTLIICPPNTVATICSEDRKVELSATAPVVTVASCTAAITLQHRFRMCAGG